MSPAQECRQFSELCKINDEEFTFILEVSTFDADRETLLADHARDFVSARPGHAGINLWIFFDVYFVEEFSRETEGICVCSVHPLVKCASDVHTSWTWGLLYIL
jgi:hypothetical protein